MSYYANQMYQRRLRERALLNAKRRSIRTEDARLIDVVAREVEEEFSRTDYLGHRLRIAYNAVMEHDCQHCKAPKTEDCVTSSGKPVLGVHANRWNRARQVYEKEHRTGVLIKQ
jgi:hypothetical protein